ncbi:DUF2267 domain-containing protein [Cohaesibacter gelatinilyticus]|uniref:DUF2267 domain-containing protein n=1 Tax=Cohaesibacter gelatinilyticus TaxID=372072 RepID=A0A285NDQ2_9HYPH|nr:DUF2267 domain-containing protein [Cohaesibacter gelatinilyticus]SNZ07023.1 hypothetical protein SAMN06265368_0619 [Cohaesibacter gelatinilyticus]
MDEIIERIASAAGISPDIAKTAVQIILKFLNKEAPDDKMSILFDALPGASDLVSEDEGSSGGGLLGGLMGSMGGMGGAMAAMNELNSAGLDMGQVQSVASELIGAAKESVGEEVVDEIVSSVPGLNQII